jgi:hypothetical protein
MKDTAGDLFLPSSVLMPDGVFCQKNAVSIGESINKIKNLFIDQPLYRHKKQ